jgi:hypothetical protein
MGRREGKQGQFFYSFDLDKVVPSNHLVRQIDGVLDLVSRLGSQGACGLLLAHRSSLDRSSVDDPHVDRGLRVRDPVGAAAVR